MRVLLNNRNFTRLWIAQVVLALGDTFMRMGLLEFFRVHGLNVKVETAKILFAATLPGAVFGPFAIAYLDRWQRRSVLMISDALRAVLVVIIAVWLLPVLTGRIEQRGMLIVYGMVFLIGAVTTFSYPARYALMPNLVEAGRLVQANTLLTTSLAAANVGGMALGGFVAERLGVEWAVLANTLAYVTSIALVWLIQMQPHATSGGVNAHPEGGWGELKTGLTYLRQHHNALPLVALTGVFAFLGGILFVSIIGYALDTLQLGTAGLGYLMAAAGVGAAIGVVALGRGGAWTRTLWLPFVQLILGGCLLGLLSVISNPWTAAALLVALGAIVATALIPIDAKLQEQVDDQRRGAVFAARGILTSMTMLVAFWLQWGTPLFRRTHAPTILLWLGIGSILAAVLTLLAMRQKAKRQ